MHETRAGIQSVEVGFTLLDALARAAGPLMLRDLAAAAGMSAAKAHRYLVSFQRLGLVVQDPRTTRYDLGPAALHLGLASLSRIDAVKLARERIGGWMLDIGHAVALAVSGNRGPTIVQWEEALSVIAVHLRLGDVMPLLTSATGRCFAAHASIDAINPLLAAELALQGKRSMPDTPTTPEAVQQMLAQVRTQGLARAKNSLLSAVAGFCAPVFVFTGHMVLGVITLGAMAQFDSHWDSPIAQALRAAARRLSTDLGYQA